MQRLNIRGGKQNGGDADPKIAICDKFSDVATNI